MTLYEKAKELVDKFYQLLPLNKDVNTTDGELHWEYNDWEQAKKCALIAVDEILKIKGNLNFDYVWYEHRDTDINNWYDTESFIPIRVHAIKYWQKVKQEIEKL